ncbi:hypothetical protein ACJJTC_017936 [Scirpophaga incertulas]
MTCKLSEFEKSIEFSANNNTFRLKGIIGYSPGHFVAFCRRSNNQWELHNDLSTKEVRITHDPTITPTAAIFIRRDTAGTSRAYSNERGRVYTEEARRPACAPERCACATHIKRHASQPEAILRMREG